MVKFILPLHQQASIHGLLETTSASNIQWVPRGVLFAVCALSANIAIMNLLPIPALDGSHVVFTLIEWVRGKPINRKVENIIHTVGLISLFLLAIILDIVHFVTVT